MIRTSPATIHRAAAVVLAAAVLSFSNHRAAAQTSVDLFAGTLGTPTQLTTTPTTANVTGSFGPGYTGNVALTLSVNNTLSEGFTPNGASNSFTITQTGLATLAGTTTASKYFGTILTPNTTYTFTLVNSTAAAVSLLTSFQVALYNGDPATTTTPFVNTATGTGLLNAVNLVGLFNTTNTNASFTFTTPANYSTASGLGVSFRGNLTAGLAGGSLTFSSASITQVPEPRPAVAMLLGVGGLAAMHFRRRLRAA